VLWCIREGRTRGVAPAPRRGPVPKPPRSPLAAFGQNIQTYPRRAAFCRTPRAASLSPMPFVEVGVATAAPRIAACRCWLSAATPLLGLEQCCSAWSGLAQLQRERAHRFVLASTHRPGTTHLGISTAASRPAAPPAPPPARARRRSASAARRGTCHGPLRRRRAEMRSQCSYCSCPHTPAADAKSVQSQCGCLRCGATAA
jgi:hypothetical protein